MLTGPGAGLLAVGQLRQRRCQQRRELFLIDPAFGQRVIQCAVTAGERCLQQLDQRRDGMVGAQDRVAQLKQGIRPRGQAAVQPGAELPQRQEPADSIRCPCRVRCRRGIPDRDDGKCLLKPAWA